VRLFVVYDDDTDHGGDGARLGHTLLLPRSDGYSSSRSRSEALLVVTRRYFREKRPRRSLCAAHTGALLARARFSTARRSR
jgi:hypothetical protein